MIIHSISEIGDAISDMVVAGPDRRSRTRWSGRAAGSTTDVNLSS